jgi:hypothetical protein
VVYFQQLNLLSVLPETPVVPLADARQTEKLRKNICPLSLENSDCQSEISMNNS